MTCVGPLAAPGPYTTTHHTQAPPISPTLTIRCPLHKWVWPYLCLRGAQVTRSTLLVPLLLWLLLMGLLLDRVKAPPRSELPPTSSSTTYTAHDDTHQESGKPQGHMGSCAVALL